MKIRISHPENPHIEKHELSLEDFYKFLTSKFHNSIIITGTSSTLMACDRRTPKYGGNKPMQVENAKMNNPSAPVKANTMTMKAMGPIIEWCFSLFLIMIEIT